jgi:hypothetical protein
MADELVPIEGEVVDGELYDGHIGARNEVNDAYWEEWNEPAEDRYVFKVTLSRAWLYRQDKYKQSQVQALIQELKRVTTSR